MQSEVLELDRFRSANFDFFWWQSGERARIDRRTVPSARSRCGRLDLIEELGEAPDDPIVVLERHLRRLHLASTAMKVAPKGSWARRYWSKVHRQLARRRESLEMPWMSDLHQSPGELLWNPRATVAEPQLYY